MARALINAPAKAKRGDIIEIKTLISHNMETGFRPDNTGKAVPRDIITDFICKYNGQEIFRAELFPAIAANPFLTFYTVATESGTLSFEWTGDNGFTATESVDITGIGYAIGHYARWIKPGSVRIDATSGDPLVQVTAFRNDKQGRATLVMINNSRIAKNVTANLAGLALTGDVTGEQSTSSGYWKPIAAFSPASSAGFSITLPELSVTSVGVSWSGATPPQAAGESTRRLSVAGGRRN